MFSSLFQVLDNLKFCEINNIKPILNMGEKFLYTDGKENSWNYYFESINDGNQEGEVHEITKINNTCNFFIDDYLMIKPSQNDYRLKLWNLVNDDKNLFIHRQEIKNMIDKYIKPLPFIKSEIDNFIVDNFKSESILSVHVRSTDYKFNNLSLIIEKIYEIQKNNNYEKIFVASDSLEAIIGIYNSLPNVCYYKTNLRCEKINEEKPLCHIVFDQDKIKHGRDVLIECFLLSKGKEIICINSNVAGMACYLNPDMKINMVHRQAGGG